MGINIPNIGFGGDVIGNAVIEIIADDKAYQKGLSKSRKDLQTFDREAERITKNVSRNFALAGGAIAAGLAVTIAKFAEFERSMKNVQAVAGATGEEYVKLKNFALEMGSATVFSAREAGEAMFFLASAGQSVSEQMATTASVLDLAAATQSGLAESAQIIVNSLSAFQLQADQSRRVADLFAQSISSSQASLGKLRTALPQTATVFNDLNQSIETNVAALSLLFDRGVRAETAATGLRNNLLTLLDATPDVTAGLSDLGLSVEELNPQMNSLVDIVQKLEKAGFDTADSVKIFGKESNALSVLVSTGAEKLREFEQSLIGAAGAAETMKDIQLDSLAGDLDLLKSSAEGAAIAFGEGLSPAVRTAAETLTELISAFNALPGPVKSALSIATASAAGLLLTLAGIGLIIPKIGIGFKKLSKFTKLVGTDVSILGGRLAGLGAAGTTALSFLLGIPAGIALYAVAMKLGTNAIDDMKEEVLSLDKALTNQQSNVAKIQRGIDEWKEELALLNKAGNEGVTWVQRWSERTQEWMDLPIAFRVSEVEGVIANLNKELRIAGGDFRGLVLNSKAGTKEITAFGKAIEAAFNPMQALARALKLLQENADLSAESFILLREAADFLDIAEQERQVVALGRKVKGVKELINSLIDTANKSGKRFISTEAITLSGMLGNVLRGKAEAEDELTTFDSIDFSEYLTGWEEVTKKLRGFGEITSETFNASTEELLAFVDEMLDSSIRGTTVFTGLMNTRSQITKQFVSEQLAEIKASGAATSVQIEEIDNLVASLKKRNITETALTDILEESAAARVKIFTDGIRQLKTSSTAETDNADSIIRDQLKIVQAHGGSYQTRIQLIDDLKSGLSEETELYQELSDAQADLFTAFIKGEKAMSEAEANAIERIQIQLAKDVAPVSIESAQAILDELAEGYAQDSEEFAKFQAIKAQLFSNFIKGIKSTDKEEEDSRLGILDNLTEAQRRFYNNLSDQTIDYTALTKSQLEIVEETWEEAGDTIAGGMRAAISEAAAATTDWKDVFTDAVGDAKSATDDLFVSIFSQEDEKRARELNREIRKYNLAIEELTEMQEKGIEKIGLYEVGIEDFGRAVGPVEDQILKLQDAIQDLNDEADDKPNRWEQYFKALKDAAIRNLAELTTDTAWTTFVKLLDRLDRPKPATAAVTGSGDAGDIELTGVEEVIDLSGGGDAGTAAEEARPEDVEVRTTEEEEEEEEERKDRAGTGGKVVAAVLTALEIAEIAKAEFSREKVAEAATRLGLPEEAIEAKLEDVFASHGFKKIGEPGGIDFETALGTRGITQPGSLISDLFIGEGLAGVKQEVARLQREAALKQLEEEDEEPSLAPGRGLGFDQIPIEAIMEHNRRRRIFVPDRPREMARPERITPVDGAELRSDNFVRIEQLQINMPDTIGQMSQAELDQHTTRQVDSIVRAFDRRPDARRRMRR